MRVSRYLNKSAIGIFLFAVVISISVSSTALADYAAAVLADNPIGYWRLNEQPGVAEAPNLGTLGAVADGEYFGDDIAGFAGPNEVAELIGFGADNTAIFLDEFIDISGVSVVEPILDDLRAFTLEGWIKPLAAETSNRAGLFGQDNAIEFGFIGASDIQMWAELPGGGDVHIDSIYDYPNDEWHHIAITGDGDAGEVFLYIDGEEAELTANNSMTLDDLGKDSYGVSGNPFNIGGGPIFGNDTQYAGAIDEVAVYDKALTQEQVKAHFDAAFQPTGGLPALKAGDANRDLKFDQIDLVQVQVAAKYLTGNPATWGEGDWNGAPGGNADAPPPGDGLFDQLDIIAALNANVYLTGPYAAIAPGGDPNDEQTSIVYNPATGELAVNAPASTQLTSVNIDSAASIFTGAAALNLGGSFDNDSDDNIFKATFGSSFGSISFGNVAQTGLSEDFVLNDLTVIGSLAGGGDLGNVDLIYVPEPSTVLLMLLAAMGAALFRVRRRIN